MDKNMSEKQLANLDPDHKGEVLVKLKGLTDEIMRSVKRNAMQKCEPCVIEELIEQLFVLVNLIVRTAEDELTIHDLEFIDNL